MIIDQPNHAIFAFDQGRTTLHPIAAIIIGNAAELMNSGAVNVAAQNGVDAKLGGVPNNRFLEFPDELDRWPVKMLQSFEPRELKRMFLDWAVRLMDKTMKKQ